MTIVTRFAPSPTGYLHVGGARTALFNWLFARHHGGRFILRIDDTDRARSTDAAVAAILDGLTWLGLTWDAGPVYQHQLLARHAEVARTLLESGHAYRCWASPEELEAMREAARRAGRPPRYDGRWRDRDPATAPAGIDPVIRLKAPQTGATVIDDQILGRIEINNAELDDFILLRADGNPTYMLSTVVDDHDLGVTHVIRGNEHLTNAARQIQIFDALGWTRPLYGHIPLIHGADGAKLSKRHGAVGVESYRDDGFLPQAMVDYLSRLGWSHGIEEYLSLEETIARFDLSAIGRAPARFDLDKLTSVNFHYMKLADDRALAEQSRKFLAKLLEREISDSEIDLLTRAMPGLKERAKTLIHLAETAAFYLRGRPLPIEAAAASLLDAEAVVRLSTLRSALAELPDWTREAIETQIKASAAEFGLGFGKLAQPLRAAVTGRTNSPGIAEVMFLLGRDEALGRLDDALKG